MKNRADWRGELERFLDERRILLGPDQWDLLGRYLKEVLEYRKKVNLTSAASEPEIAFRHLADAFASLPILRTCLEGKDGTRLLDVGSGAGFLGLTLKIAWPEAEVWLLESNYKKFQFLNWAVTFLGLRKAKVLWKRLEHLALKGHFDGVLERAVAPLEKIAGPCLSLTRQGGYFLAYRSDCNIPEKVRRIQERFGGDIYRTDSYVLPGETRTRFILTMRKGT